MKLSAASAGTSSGRHIDMTTDRVRVGGIAVDGGRDYIRRGGDLDSIIERSMYIDSEALQGAQDALNDAAKSGRNTLGCVLAVMRSLRDNGLLDMDKFTGQ